jgi:hypothetical protein
MTHPYVEAVARAIFANSHPGLSWDDDLIEGHRDWYRTDARAAITTLAGMKPTEGMVEEVRQKCSTFYRPLTAREAKEACSTMLSQLVREIEGDGHD